MFFAKWSRIGFVLTVKVVLNAWGRVKWWRDVGRSRGNRLLLYTRTVELVGPHMKFAARLIFLLYSRNTSTASISNAWNAKYVVTGTENAEQS